MQNSQQKRYLINSSRTKPASSNYIVQSPTSNQVQSRPVNQPPYLNESIRESIVPPRSRASQYPVKSIVLKDLGEKKKVLQKYKYINQLARMEYEDKEEISKATVQKKIMARNQIAQFENEDQDQNQWFDQLMEFKFGKEGQFHYEKQQEK